MEEKTLTEYRLKEIERELKEQETKLSELDKNFKKLSDRHNDRYLEVTKLNTKLEEGYKGQQTTVSRLLTSIDGLISEMKKTNDVFHSRFNDVDTRFNRLENKVGQIGVKQTSDEAVASYKNSETTNENTLGNTQKGAIVLGIMGVLEVFIRYVAPLFFN